MQDFKITPLCDNICQWLATGRWFSPGTSVSSNNNTDCHYIAEILLKVALNTIILTLKIYLLFENQYVILVKDIFMTDMYFWICSNQHQI
jgi:hypothetical protein